MMVSGNAPQKPKLVRAHINLLMQYEPRSLVRFQRQQRRDDKHGFVPFHIAETNRPAIGPTAQHLYLHRNECDFCVGA